ALAWTCERADLAESRAWPRKAEPGKRGRGHYLTPGEGAIVLFPGAQTGQAPFWPGRGLAQVAAGFTAQKVPVPFARHWNRPIIATRMRTSPAWVRFWASAAAKCALSASAK